MRGRDITGQEFGRLTAIHPTEKRASGYTMWSCRCKCDNEKLVSVNHLLQGNVKSCGCLVQEKWWTEEKKAQLKELVKHHTEAEIAKIMKRTKTSIRGQKSLMGLKSGRTWDEKKFSQLKILISEGKSNQEIAKVMHRTRSSIQQAKARIGLRDFSVRKWTKEDEVLLRELAKEMTIAELVQHFNREWTSVERKCKSLGIQTQSRKVVILGPYTEEEDAYLIKHSWYLTNLQLAEKMNRPEGSIKQRKTRLRKQGFKVGTCSAYGMGGKKNVKT